MPVVRYKTTKGLNNKVLSFCLIQVLTSQKVVPKPYKTNFDEGK